MCCNMNENQDTSEQSIADYKNEYYIVFGDKIEEDDKEVEELENNDEEQGSIKKRRESTEVIYEVDEYVCSHCLVKFSNLNDLIEHYTLYQHYLNCSKCTFKKVLIDQLLEHIKDEHEEYKLENILLECIFGEYKYKRPIINEEITIKCILCHEVEYNSLIELYYHLIDDHNYCFLCSLLFTNKDDLEQHKHIHYQNIKLYKCEQCTDTFINDDIFKNHTEIKHNGDIINCIEIERKIYNAHKPILNGCPYCGLILKESKDVYAHFILHTINECHECENQFIDIDNNKSDNELHLCNLCKPTIFKHIIIDIPCLFCDFKGSSEIINEHINNTHNYCRLCNILLSSKSMYDEHMNKHETVEIICNYCHTVFDSYDLFEIHRKNKHPLKIESMDDYKIINNETIPIQDIDKLKENKQCPFCYLLLKQDDFLSHLTGIHNIIICLKCTGKFNKDSCIDAICKMCSCSSSLEEDSDDDDDDDDNESVW